MLLLFFSLDIFLVAISLRFDLQFLCWLTFLWKCFALNLLIQHAWNEKFAEIW